MDCLCRQGNQIVILPQATFFASFPISIVFILEQLKTGSINVIETRDINEFTFLLTN